MQSTQSATTHMILTLVSSSLLLLTLITVTDVISTKEDVSGSETNTSKPYTSEQ